MRFRVRNQVCHAGTVGGVADGDQHSGPGALVAVNLARVMPNPAARVHEPADATPVPTGIDKRAAAGPVAVHRLGLAGDTICDTANHGGLDQAVYAYAIEDTEWWQAGLGAELAVALRPGSFGENLTVRGVDVTGAVIGERWQVGSTLLQVSVPRIPCSTFAAFWGVDRLVKRFTVAGRPGAYLRVLSEGELSAGDPVTVLDRPAHGLTIEQTFRAMTGDRSLAARLVGAPELPAAVRENAARWLAATG
jgi:MOSC domain-containing protein YiiM